MRNACDSDSRCGLACDASARDAKSLAIRIERCEPLSTGTSVGYPILQHIAQKLCDPPLPRKTSTQYYRNIAHYEVSLLGLQARGQERCPYRLFAWSIHKDQLSRDSRDLIEPRDSKTAPIVRKMKESDQCLKIVKNFGA